MLHWRPGHFVMHAGVDTGRAAAAGTHTRTDYYDFARAAYVLSLRVDLRVASRSVSSERRSERERWCHTRKETASLTLARGVEVTILRRTPCTSRESQARQLARWFAGLTWFA